QQEAAALDVELVEFGAEIHAGGAVDALDRRAGPLRGERVEPVEGLAGFRRAESGLEQAVLEGVAVADEVRVFGEVVFEQIEQDVQDALFHFPRPAPGGAVFAVSWRLRA